MCKHVICWFLKKCQNGEMPCDLIEFNQLYKSFEYDVYFDIDEITNMRIHNSANAIIYTNYYGVIPCVLLGKERDGSYANKYNMFGGRSIHEDEHCWCKCASRELYEETGQMIQIPVDNFDEFPVMIINGTPIFCVRRDNIHRQPINDKLTYLYTSCISNSLTEMIDVQFISIETKEQLDSVNHGEIIVQVPVEISEYSRTALNNFSIIFSNI